MNFYVDRKAGGSASGDQRSYVFDGALAGISLEGMLRIDQELPVFDGALAGISLERDASRRGDDAELQNEPGGGSRAEGVARRTAMTLRCRLYRTN